MMHLPHGSNPCSLVFFAHKYTHLETGTHAHTHTCAEHASDAHSMHTFKLVITPIPIFLLRNTNAQPQSAGGVAPPRGDACVRRVSFSALGTSCGRLLRLSFASVHQQEPAKKKKEEKWNLVQITTQKHARRKVCAPEDRCDETSPRVGSRSRCRCVIVRRVEPRLSGQLRMHCSYSAYRSFAPSQYPPLPLFLTASLAEE